MTPKRTARLSKALLGHLAKFGVNVSRAKAGEPAVLQGVRRIREFRDFSLASRAGELLGLDLFVPGDFVDAIGVTKGRGFEGVVGRHGFRGGDATHGAKGWHRRAGAIGQRLFPGTVMRGMRMPGHLGQVRRTTQNLEVVQVLPEDATHPHQGRHSRGQRRLRGDPGIQEDAQAGGRGVAEAQG